MSCLWYGGCSDIWSPDTLGNTQHIGLWNVSLFHCAEMNICTTRFLILVDSTISVLSGQNICLEYYEVHSDLGFICHANTLYPIHKTQLQCKRRCTNAPSCTAIDCNTSKGICEPKECLWHEAQGEPFMQYFRFTQIRSEACVFACRKCRA